MTRTPVVIINGFLGSGKTTLLRQLLIQAHRQQLAVSVLVNEMSGLDVDGMLIADTDIVGRDSHSFSSIAAQSLSSPDGIRQLDSALQPLLQAQPDLILIETSGSSHPLPLTDYFRDHQQAELKAILVLADSIMLEQDFDSGRQLIPALQQNLQEGSRNTVNLLAEQIMYCSHLYLTRTDRLPQGRAETIARAVHPLNPAAGISAIQYGRLDLEQVLAMPGYDFHRVALLTQELKPLLQADSEEDNTSMVTEVIKDDRPFHPQRLWDTCQQFLGRQVYRSKGFFWLPGRDRYALLWNQAAGSISLELVSYWRSGILEDETHPMSKRERQQLREKLTHHGRFGDRICHLTVIGEQAECRSFCTALQHCFLTEEEITFWQSGGHFPDPWPADISTRKL